jgi:hypothetical protein
MNEHSRYTGFWILMTFMTMNCQGQIPRQYGCFIPDLFEVYNQFSKFNSYNVLQNQTKYGCFYREELPGLKIKAVRKKINTDPISYTLEQNYYDINGYITEQIGYSVKKMPARDTDRVESIKFSYTEDKRYVTARAISQHNQKSYNQYTIYHVNDSVDIDTIFWYNDSLFRELSHYTVLSYDSLRRITMETSFNIPGDGRLVMRNVIARYNYLSNEDRIREYSPEEDRYVQERMRISLMKYSVRDSLIDIVVDSTKWGHHVYWSIFDEVRLKFVAHYIETKDMVIEFGDPSGVFINNVVRVYFKSNNSIVKNIQIEYSTTKLINSYSSLVRVIYIDNTPNKEKWYGYVYFKEISKNGLNFWKKKMLTRNGTFAHGLPASLKIMGQATNNFSPMYIKYTYE